MAAKYSNAYMVGIFGSSRQIFDQEQQDDLLSKSVVKTQDNGGLIFNDELFQDFADTELLNQSERMSIISAYEVYSSSTSKNSNFVMIFGERPSESIEPNFSLIDQLCTMLKSEFDDKILAIDLSKKLVELKERNSKVEIFTSNKLQPVRLCY